MATANSGSVGRGNEFVSNPKNWEVNVVFDYKIDLSDLPENISADEIDILARQVMHDATWDRNMLCMKLKNDLSRRIDVLLERKKAEELLPQENIMVTRR